MADRHAAAVQAAATRKASGKKSGFAAMSGAQRSINAKKAAAARKAKGIKSGFAKLTFAQRSANAKKAMATRKASGAKIGFAKLGKSTAVRNQAVHHRMNANHHPFANMTAAQRSARAKKAYATRVAMAAGAAPKLKSVNGKLRKHKRTLYTAQPTTRKLNPLKSAKRRLPRAVRIKDKRKYNHSKRLVL